MTERFAPYIEQEIIFASRNRFQRTDTPPEYVLQLVQDYVASYPILPNSLGIPIIDLTDTGIEILVGKLYEEHRDLVSKAAHKQLPVVLTSGIVNAIMYEVITGDPITKAPKDTRHEVLELFVSVLYFPSQAKRPYDPGRAVIEIGGKCVATKIPAIGTEKFQVAIIQDGKEELVQRVVDYFKQAVFAGGITNLKLAATRQVQPFSGEVFVWSEPEFNVPQEVLARYNGRIKFRPRYQPNKD
ncbi:hypothetical protein J4206_07240 [Candidatus Woesearchaeota archaeon]|nr:hypothetical protein [Candidatus Woesearchaeota archaeon]